MMKTRNIRRYIITAAYCICAINTYAQIDADAKMKQMFREIKSLDNYGYQYTVDALFPDGTKDQMKGEMYTSAEKRIMYSVNNAYTVYCTPKWFYQATHQNKLVTIVNMEKSGGKIDLFKTDFFKEYVDSFLLRYAKIESYTEVNNTTRLNLSFREGYITNMEVVYNSVEHIPVSLVLHVFQKDPMQKKSNVGTTQTITCSKYARYTKRNDIAEYFSVKNGKAQLNRYKNYKIQATL